MAKPVEYTLRVQGFGVWRISYAPARRRWELAYNARVTGEQWRACGDFVAPESAALAVIGRETGVPGWDALRFAAPSSGDLRHWQTDASEGVQADAGE